MATQQDGGIDHAGCTTAFRAGLQVQPTHDEVGGSYAGSLRVVRLRPLDGGSGEEHSDTTYGRGDALWFGARY